MSKKTHWRLFSSSDTTKYLSPEEKEEYRKNKRKEDRRAFKVYDRIKKMPVEKPKFNKAPAHKVTKEKEE